MNAHASYRSTVAIAAALAATLAAGCGTSAYESRVDEGMKALRVGLMFSAISPTPSEIPGTTISLRLPTFINAASKAYTEESAEPNGQGKVNPARLHPPFLKLPGLRICYEMDGLETEQQSPVLYYCYLATVPVGEPMADGKPFEESIQAQLTAALGGQPQWETMACPTQAGQSVPWRRISATGGQAFLEPTGESKSHAAVFELYAKEVDGLRVLIGWRYPKNINQTVADTARLVAGSISGGQDGGANPPAAD